VSDLESQWLQQTLRGDAEAFSHLIEAYQEPVYNLCYRMLGNAIEAEDAAQESFLRAYQNLKHYDVGRPFTTWLLSIAAHHCIDQIRRRRFAALSYDAIPQIEPPDLSPGPESVLMERDEQRQVQELLVNLNPSDRAAIVLRYWYDLSYEEIGESLSLSVSAVKSRLHRARRELAQLWMQREPHPMREERSCHESPAF
jgi:RNA polymerase sigma-70 factor (ECF subfamily)